MSDHRITHYIVLFLGFALFALLFTLFRYNAYFENIFVVSIGIFYCTWGLLHHYFEDRLNRLVILEYLSFTTFTVVLLLTVLNL